MAFDSSKGQRFVRPLKTFLFGFSGLRRLDIVVDVDVDVCGNSLMRRRFPQQGHNGQLHPLEVKQYQNSDFIAILHA